MKSRYLFLAGGAIFLILAGVELFRIGNYVGTAINAVTGAIFLYLGWAKPKPRK